MIRRKKEHLHFRRRFDDRMDPPAPGDSYWLGFGSGLLVAGAVFGTLAIWLGP